MRKIIVLLLIIYFPVNSQILIETTSGNEFIGFNTNNTKDSISIITLEKIKYTFARKDIIEIKSRISELKIVNGKTIEGFISKYDENQISIIQDNDNSNKDTIIMQNDILLLKIKKKYEKEFLTFGATLGTPGLINLNGGYEFGRIGFRAMLGMYPPEKLFGTQLNVFYNFYSGKDVETGVSLGLGYILHDTKDFSYAGPFYHLNAFGIFLEFGLGIGYGELKSPQLMGQIGYVYRFN